MHRFLTVAALFAVSLAIQADAFDLTREGQPVAVIVTPDEATDIEKEAAQLIHEMIRRVSGASLAIIAESKVEPEAGPRLVVGHTKLAAQAGIDTDGVRWDGYRIRRVGDDVFILGRDY